MLPVICFLGVNEVNCIFQNIIHIIILFVLIGLMQLGTRCGDGFCEAAEYLISGFSAIEAEAELVQIGLKLCAAAVIGSQQERLQVADGFVQPERVVKLLANGW